eukprot:3382224-Lingulodinium_polyedra.AAC.1
MRARLDPARQAFDQCPRGDAKDLLHGVGGRVPQCALRLLLRSRCARSGVPVCPLVQPFA